MVRVYYPSTSKLEDTMPLPAIEGFQDVLWAITEKCNMKCVYCSVSAGNHPPSNPELSKSQIDNVLKQLTKLPKLQSLILSGGEAFLSPDFPYILEKSSSLFSNIYVITNGMFIPQKASDALILHRPSVMISIDSFNEDVNRQTRGMGVLHKTLATLKKLQSMDLEIIVISVVTKYNIEDYENYFSILLEHGVKNILLQQLHCEGKARGDFFKSLSPAPQQIDRLYDLLVRIEAANKGLTIDYNEICFFQMRKKEHAAKCRTGLRYKPQRLFMCGAGYQFFAIKTNGDIIPCNALQSCILGNIYRQEITDMIRTSKELRHLDELRSLRVNVIEGCHDCAYAPICDGGCRADALHLTGDALSRHPYCNVSGKINNLEVSV